MKFQWTKIVRGVKAILFEDLPFADEQRESLTEIKYKILTELTFLRRISINDKEPPCKLSNTNRHKIKLVIM